jgi:hypothetical protein
MSGAELAARTPAEVEDDRAYTRLMRQASLFAKMPGLPPAVQDKPEAIAAMMASLNGWGLPITLPGLYLFDWIEGKAVPSAQLYAALAHRQRYRVEPVVRTAEKAVARVVGPDGNAVEVEFSLKDAMDAHRLDEWVEQWGENRDTHKRFKAATWILRVNGQATEGEPPGWAKEEEQKGRVKRYDAWWNYRTDMLWKSALKRAIRIACPDVLLGGSADYDHAPPVRYEPALRSLGYTEPVDVEASTVADPVPAPADPDDLGRPFE